MNVCIYDGRDFTWSDFCGPYLWRLVCDVLMLTHVLNDSQAFLVVLLLLHRHWHCFCVALETVLRNELTLNLKEASPQVSAYQTGVSSSRETVCSEPKTLWIFRWTNTVWKHDWLFMKLPSHEALSAKDVVWLFANICHQNTKTSAFY